MKERETRKAERDKGKTSIILNLLLVLVSIVFTMLLLEFIVFRYILPAGDYPALQFANSIIKYIPNQTGTYRVKNEIRSRFRINSNGWNSRHDSYQRGKTPGKYRIALIGDSYVEALMVDYDKSLAEQLEQILGTNGSEVYRFAISGASLSQYLHMLRQEVIKYSPDLVIIVLVHNDFDESYKYQQGVYTNSFMKLRLESNQVNSEILPVQFQKPWYSFLRNSATWRFLAYRHKVRFQLLRDIILRKPTKNKQNQRYQANINISDMDRKYSKNKLAADYIFKNIKETCEKHDSQLLLIIDGDRNSIYQHLDRRKLYAEGALSLNRLAKSIAEKYDIPFIDLHPIFENDYRVNHKRFDFLTDAHWNSYAHRLVAEILARYMQQHYKPDAWERVMSLNDN